MIGDSINTENIIIGEISDEGKALIGNNILDGEATLIGNIFSGYSGQDGFSPLVTVSKEGNKTIITITDKRGTTFAEVFDGVKGDVGPAGKDAIINGVNALNIVEGANINLKQVGNTLTIAATGNRDNTNDYNLLFNKPKINNIELNNNKTLDELGIQSKGDYATEHITNTELEKILK